MLRFAAVFLAVCIALPARAQSVQPPAAATASPTLKNPAPSKKASPSRQRTPAGEGPCAVGVIPLAGDRFEVKKIGMTVFGNEYKAIPVDWGLEDLIVERVRAAVGPGKVVRRITHPKGALDAYDPGGSPLWNRDEKSAALLARYVGHPRCERYVVITRSGAQYVGNQAINGVGVVNVGSPMLSKTYVHALVYVDVHDGQSLAVLKRGRASINGNDWLLGPPTRRLEDFSWPDSPEAAMTPNVRAAARSMLAEVLDKTLPGMMAP